MPFIKVFKSSIHSEPHGDRLIGVTTLRFTAVAAIAVTCFAQSGEAPAADVLAWQLPSGFTGLFVATDDDKDSGDSKGNEGESQIANLTDTPRSGAGGSGGKAKKKKKKAAEEEPEEPTEEADAPADEQTATESDAPDGGETKQAEAEAPPADEPAPVQAEAPPADDHVAADTMSAAPVEEGATQDQSGQTVTDTAGECGAKVAEETSHADEPHWTYEGESGPENWASLSPTYEMCGAGARQTPINLASGEVVPLGLEDVKFNYGTVAGEVINNGHTIQVNVEEGQSIEVDGAAYNLAQFHFHTPSEHTIDGGAYPMEMHLVHKDQNGMLAVVGVMLEKGEKNAVLTQVLGKLPKTEGKPTALKEPIDLNTLLPADRSAYRYLGSLTTPPCSEGVKWMVMKASMTVTGKQIAGFKKIFPMNARPLQPINSRSVLEDVTSESSHASN